MANTIDDVIMKTGEFIDVYALSGILPGTSLILNNKSSGIALVQVRASKPSASSSDGWPIKSGTANESWVTITDVPAGSRVWVKGAQGGRLFVQEFEE